MDTRDGREEIKIAEQEDEEFTSPTNTSKIYLHARYPSSSQANALTPPTHITVKHWIRSSHNWGEDSTWEDRSKLFL